MRNSDGPQHNQIDVRTAACNKSFQSLVFVPTQLHFGQWNSLPFCLRSLIVKWPTRIVHFSLATAHDCETGLLRHLCESLQLQTSSRNRSVLHILKLSDVTGANYSDTVYRVDRKIQLVTRNISIGTTYYWKLPERFLGNKVDLRSFYSYTCGMVVISLL